MKYYDAPEILNTVLLERIFINPALLTLWDKIRKEEELKKHFMELYFRPIGRNKKDIKFKCSDDFATKAQIGFTTSRQV